MGYYCYVENINLEAKGNVDEQIKDGEFYMDWVQLEDGTFDLSGDRDFKWADEFEKDMLMLQELGVRGEVLLTGECHEWFKYIIEDADVYYVEGDIVFPDENRRRIDTIKL